MNMTRSYFITFFYFNSNISISILWKFYLKITFEGVGKATLGIRIMVGS